MKEENWKMPYDWTGEQLMLEWKSPAGLPLQNLFLFPTHPSKFRILRAKRRTQFGRTEGRGWWPLKLQLSLMTEGRENRLTSTTKAGVKNLTLGNVSEGNKTSSYPLAQTSSIASSCPTSLLLPSEVPLCWATSFMGKQKRECPSTWIPWGYHSSGIQGFLFFKPQPDKSRSSKNFLEVEPGNPFEWVIYSNSAALKECVHL